MVGLAQKIEDVPLLSLSFRNWTFDSSVMAICSLTTRWSDAVE